MRKSPDRIVVIGAGIGGLAAAMRLASAGLSVTLLEAHGEPGGKMRTVPSIAGPVDAGPTVLTMRHVFDELFEAAGRSLDAHVTLHREHLLARHFWPDGSTLDLFDDADRSAEAIHAFAGPRAEGDFRRFATSARLLFEAFEEPMILSDTPSSLSAMKKVLADPKLLAAMAPGSTMARQLAREFSDPRLRQLFGRYSTYVGGSPYLSPAILRLIWDTEARGVWRVAGGMHRLADAMASVAEALGATIRYDAPASRIEVQSGRIVAVHSLGGARHSCDGVVFNGDPRALAENLLGPAVRHAVPARAVEPRSLSANVWSFAAEASGVDLAHHNVFFGRDPRTEFEPIAAGNLPEDPTLYVCAQDRGNGLRPSGPERFEIIMNAPAVSADAKWDIAQCRTRTFPILSERGLRFRPEPPDSALTTPSDFAELFPASLGSLYGRSPHGMMSAFARPTARTAIPGLYLAGGGAHPGAGIPMAALSGKHAAEAIVMDRTSTSTSLRTGMPGGMSMGSAPAEPALSRSSPS